MNPVSFPPFDICLRLLRISPKVDKTFISCKHMQGELFRLPPTVIGRIARSFLVTLSEQACLSVALKAALDFPVLYFRECSVGVLYDSVLPRTCKLSVFREVSLSSACALSIPLCALSLSSEF